MGNAISQTRLAIREFFLLLKTYNALSKRLQLSPGFPVANPTRSFWMVPPSAIAKHRSSPDLPAHADVVIIGSGITGASVARALLEDESGQALSIVMLEARDTCSGATGRNGGHITPPLYMDYPELKANHGVAQAQALIRFRLAHITELGVVAMAEDPDNECQYRSVESLDVFYDKKMWEGAKINLDIYKRDMPLEGARFNTYEGMEAAKKYNLAKDVAGCIVTHAGSIHPYRFVTCILTRLLSTYTQFRLFTNTPCTSISEPTVKKPFYTLYTPCGAMTASHIVHATNSHVSTLLIPMRAKIIPIRGNMSAQRPGITLAQRQAPGARAYVFYTGEHGRGYDYLTQLPVGENEFMLGAAFSKGGFDEAGNTNDALYDASIAAHLSGVLPVYFGEQNWGAEKMPEGDEWFEGRVKALWSGILGISADFRPWVGRLPQKISGRVQPPASSTPTGNQERVSSSLSSVALREEKARGGATAAPGEWISAGYTGEGMVHAWLSGKAVAWMLLGRGDEVAEWLPEALRITEKRWKKAKIEDMV